jgi:putative transposase
MARARVTYRDQCHELAELRSCVEWVAEPPAHLLQQALRDVDRAYQNWWQGHARKPSFERRGQLRFRLSASDLQIRHLNRKWSEVRLPKLGWVRFRRSRSLDGELASATFRCVGGVWQVNFTVLARTHRVPMNDGSLVGVDFGIACAAYVAGESAPRIMPPTLTPGEERRLRGLERRKARQLAYAKRHNGGRYSNRLRRTIREIARLRARQARRRQDFTHKLTSDLAKNHGLVAIEDLRVKHMTSSARGTVEAPGTRVRQKAGLNRSILDVAPGERRRQLAYKCPKYGSLLVVVPPAGTSQTCPACGVRDPASRPGCGRMFARVHCGHTAHADAVAAQNILDRAIALIGGGSAVGRTVDSAGRASGPSHHHMVVGVSVKVPASVGAAGA